jgi:hypothetical protein
MAGLDPAIHVPASDDRVRKNHKDVDARVKPGHDDFFCLERPN